MPNGGEINVYITEAMIYDIKKLNLPSKRYLKIAIQDQGTGISPENQKKLFTPYFTTKPKGTGLGLATAYSILS